MKTSETIGDIASRLAKAMSAVKEMEPKGYNAFHKYNYFDITQITSESRRVLSDVGVAFFPSVAECKEEREGKNVRSLVTVTTLFVANESGEFIETTWIGEGIDNGDKSLNKAYTAAIKQCLQKTLLIGGDSDPDDSAPSLPSPQTHQTKQRPAAKKQQTSTPLESLLKMVDKNRHEAFMGALEALIGAPAEELTQANATDLIQRLSQHVGDARKKKVEEFINRYTPPEEASEPDEGVQQSLTE